MKGCPANHEGHHVGRWLQLDRMKLDHTFPTDIHKYTQVDRYNVRFECLRCGATAKVDVDIPRQNWVPGPEPEEGGETTGS